MLRSQCWLVALACVLLGSGCGGGGIPASLHIPQGTATQQVVELRSTDETQRLVQELAHVGTRGVVEGLSEEQTTARVHALVEQLTRSLVAELRAQLQSLQPTMRELTADVAATAVRSASSELSRSVGPSLRQIIIDELLKQPELRQALGEMSRDLAKQAVLGSNDALQELEAKRERSPLGAVSKLLSSTAGIVGLVLLALVGLPLVLLRRQRTKARRDRAEAERRAEVAAAILRNANVGDDATLQRLLDAVADTLSAPGSRTTKDRPFTALKHAARAA